MKNILLLLFALFISFAAKAQSNDTNIGANSGDPTSSTAVALNLEYVTSMDASEQNSKNSLIQTLQPTQTWVIKTQSLDAMYNNNNFAWTFPGTGKTEVFSMHNILNNQNSRYIDAFSAEGGSLRLNKTSSGIIGHIHSGLTNTNYNIFPLSETKILLMELDPVLDEDEEQFHLEHGEGCIEHEDDGDEDFEITNREDCNDDNKVISVLFLYTNKASENHSEDYINSVSDFVISELNSSVIASTLSLSDIGFRKAGVALLPDIEETEKSYGVHKQLQSSITAKELRDLHNADVVVLLCEGKFKNSQGDATNYANSENPYSHCTIKSALNNIKATHGIGHIIGARHQRFSLKCGSPVGQEVSVHPFSFAHGWQIHSNARTIMSDCFDIPTRVPVWSSKNGSFDGFNTGNRFNDNARRLRERAGEVSCFRKDNNSEVPMGISIFGPDQICPNQFATYLPLVNNGQSVSSFTYAWEIWSPSLNDWTPLGTNQNVIIQNIFFTRSSIIIRLKVSDSDGVIMVLEKRIFTECLEGIDIIGDNRICEEETKTYSVQFKPNAPNGTVSYTWTTFTPSTGWVDAGTDPTLTINNSGLPDNAMTIAVNVDYGGITIFTDTLEVSLECIINSISIVGSNYICDGQTKTYSVQFNPNPPTGSVSYSWSTYTPSTGWVNAGTGPTITIENNGLMDNSLLVKVTVDYGGPTLLQASKNIALQCFGGVGDDRNSDITQEATRDITISPNPTSTLTHISGIVSPIVLSVFNSAGQLIHHSNQVSDFDIDMTSYPSGMYFLKISGSNRVDYFRVVKK